jgi:hypothetical protein
MSAVPGSGADYGIAMTAQRNGATPPRAVASGRWKDAAFEWLTRAFALLVFSILAAILVSLVLGSTLSLDKYGVSFIWRDDWDPVKEEFGALVPIYGTLMTSLIAMLIGVPVSFGIALFLTELRLPGSSGRWARPSSCLPRSRRSSTACGACSCSRRCSRPMYSRCSSTPWATCRASASCSRGRRSASAC